MILKGMAYIWIIVVTYYRLPVINPSTRMKARTIICIAFLSLLLFPPIVDLILVRMKTPQLIDSFAASDKCVLDIEEIDKERIAIVLTVEDPTFYTNKGLDFSSPGAGFTTLSQGLGKILYFDKFKPGIRKIRLLFLTRFALYPLVSKKEILHLFFNYAYFGNYQGKEIRGFEFASNIYFKKSFKDLTLDQFLSLEAMLINPYEYNITAKKAKNNERVVRIKKLLACNCRPINWNDDLLNGCK